MVVEVVAGYRQAEELIRRLWREGEVILPPHAGQRMDERDVDILDIRHVLLYGRIVGHRPEGDAVRYTFHGKTLDGGRLRCVVDLGERVVIVTVVRL